MIYKVVMDTSKISSLMERFGITEYIKNRCYFFIQAEDPDEACHLAMNKLKEGVLKHNPIDAVRDIVKDFDNTTKVLKASKMKPRKR